ncbi:hypothetical protein Poly30_05300 [Planctomycetes bacterium Poly30]|uniref:Uncharacterized protein n=1 Tax=Saltatorellus ferox TaxID=2528018 RepID=A0A518ELR9_9BACT|nr:hypothetical protein Poly30_05300 [Planctomycetes bacterium Poly30]
MDPVILKGRQVKREEAPARKLAAAVASGEKQPPTVRTLVVDGVVRALEVTCSCGEVTTIELKSIPSPGGSR